MKDYVVPLSIPAEVYELWKKFIKDRAPKGYNDKPQGVKFTSELVTKFMTDVLIKEGYYEVAGHEKTKKSK